MRKIKYSKEHQQCSIIYASDYTMINLKQFAERIKEADTIITDLIREKKIITSLSERNKVKFTQFYLKQVHRKNNQVNIP